LKIVVTRKDSNVPLVDLSCPVYGGHAVCVLHDPASNANKYSFPQGAYQLYLMYGDVAAPANTFSVLP
jgi:hypothetical protein